MGGASWPEWPLVLEALASKTEIITTCPAFKKLFKIFIHFTFQSENKKYLYYRTEKRLWIAKVLTNSSVIGLLTNNIWEPQGHLKMKESISKSNCVRLLDKTRVESEEKQQHFDMCDKVRRIPGGKLFLCFLVTLQLSPGPDWEIE